MSKPAILLPLRPAFLMHKNSQRRIIIHSLRPLRCNDRSIDQKIFLNALFARFEICTESYLQSKE